MFERCVRQMMISHFFLTWLEASNQQHEAINASPSYQRFPHGGLYWIYNQRSCVMRKPGCSQ